MSHFASRRSQTGANLVAEAVFRFCIDGELLGPSSGEKGYLRQRLRQLCPQNADINSIRNAIPAFIQARYKRAK